MYEIAQAPGRAGTDCLFEVRPDERQPWIAAVRRGERWTGALTAPVATPSPDSACLIARGDAYIVDVNDPTRFVFVGTAGAVVAAHAVPTHELLLVVGPCSVTAVGKSGVVWTTGRLAIARVRLDEIDGDHVIGVADDDGWESRDLTIDLRTGRHTGGVPFE